MTRDPWLCRAGWHRWRRWPELDHRGRLVWLVVCDRCDRRADR